MSHAGPATGLFHLKSSELRDIAGFLPTVRRLPADQRCASVPAFAPCLFLMSYPSGMMTPLRNTGTKHRGLGSTRTAPHKLTPMLGVLATKARDRVFFKWKRSSRGLGERSRYPFKAMRQLDA